MLFQTLYSCVLFPFCVIQATGLLYFKIGLTELARECFEDCLKIRQSQGNPDSGDVAVVLYNLAAVHLEMGDIDNAKRYYERTLEYEYNAPNNSKTNIVDTLQSLAQLHQLNGDIDTALRYYTEGIEFCKKQYETNKPNRQSAKLYSHIGDIYGQIGEVDKAMEAYFEALKLSQVSGIDDCSNLVSEGLLWLRVGKHFGENSPAA